MGIDRILDFKSLHLLCILDNVYISWWTNKTGNDEVMFRASTDYGATFGDKINLSNSMKADSQDAQIDDWMSVSALYGLNETERH